MATPNTLIGILAKFYLNGGTYGSPTWSAIGTIGDLNVGAKWDVAEVLLRASRVKYKAKTALEIAVTGKLLASLADANYTTLRAAMLNDDVVDVMVLTGANTVNGVRGWRFDAQVINATQDQGPGNVIFDDFELTPAFTDNVAKSVLVASGAAAFTAL